MEVAYSRIIIYSCLIFGTGIFCDRQPAVSSCSVNNDDNFVCTNGPCIKWSLVCDGHKDCSDGSDETKELCAQYEYGANMNLECGKEAENKRVEETPWLVYIHRVDKMEPKTIILGLGSIIAPNVVVAMAETFWRYDLKYKQNSINDDGRYLYKIESLTNYYIVKNQNNFLTAKMIYFAEDYNISIESNADDLAVIVLADKISFRNGVLPICVDWYSKYSLQNPPLVQIDKFQRSSNGIFSTQKIFIPGSNLHTDNSSCLQLYDKYNFADSVTYDNFCIRIITENIGDEGYKYQTISILFSNYYFLTGLKSSWSTLNNQTALGFIDIKYYIPWIRGILNKHTLKNVSVKGTVNSSVLPTIKMCPSLLSYNLDIICTLNGEYADCTNPSIPDTIATASCKPTYSAPNGQQDTPLKLLCQSNGMWNKQLQTCKLSLIQANLCVLPTVEGVVYTYEDSNEILSHGTLINHTLTVNENCEVGYHKAYPNSFRVCQRNGKWKTVSENLCLKMCPPLLSDSLDIKCTLNGKHANCSNPSIPDTIASPSCKLTYSLQNGQEETPLDIHCQSNGLWNNKLYRCVPYCGRVYIKSQVLINNGEKATVGTAPWNVGIYRLNKKNFNYDLICGGSIISPNLVVSAAHCFWERGMISNTIAVNDDRYKIAVGKYARNFTVIDNKFTEIINAEIVYLKAGYNGHIGSYAEDISIVVLKNRISFSTVVAPVCIDWKSKYNLSNGDQGKIVGWGTTEKGIDSPILLEASLPYFNNSFCRNIFKNGFESFVTVDKFCAGSSSVLGQRVDKGDSGAGLCFLHSNLYHLTGVVSSKDPETTNSIAIFTDVKYHIQWIHSMYIKHN
ncbi:unnamed protein product [Macrosiphum euphorbiae]|uniref:Peptidase S1 domain-containing protein n=1 Tax=Macrosiphum euphorbiae TaxID=13131 RepID=A0AAV0VRW7_9HEMI|nr:unnamed protein product [Macrosiphum euphorbiae]